MPGGSAFGTLHLKTDRIKNMSVSTLLLDTMSSVSEPRTVKFGKTDGFMKTLRERVDGYFEENNLSKHDHPRMYVKTFFILAWLTASWVSLVLLSGTTLTAVLSAVSLGLAMAAVGFNIQHDGGHGAYSKYPIVNNLMAFTLDILGGSSFIWKRTHNIIHHSYTNVTGVDADIDVGFLGRLSPHQRHLPFHRLQHFYLWFLYGFITFKWQFVDDYLALFRGKIGTTRVPKPKGWEMTALIAGKIIFMSLAFAIPLAFHSWQNVLLFFFLASFVQGATLSIVFQLAHVMEDADFPMPDEDSMRIENEWGVHQVETTVDFAQNSRIVNWFTGGLNFQIEHHLFPQICHTHYPALAPIVKQTSEEFGVNYYAHPSLGSALASHFRFLKQLAQKPAEEVDSDSLTSAP